jgi:signal transduction histidine kinase
MLRSLLVLLLVITSLSRSSAETWPQLLLPHSIQNFSVSSKAYLYNEPKGKALSISQVKQAPFQEISKIPTFFGSSTGHWFRFRVLSHTKQTLLLNFGHYPYDALQVYLVQKSKTDSLPRMSWKNKNYKQLPGNSYVHKVSFAAGVPTYIYVRAYNSKGTMRMRCSILRETDFYKQKLADSQSNTFFVGVSFMLMFIATLIFLVNKKVHFLYYILHTLLIVLQNIWQKGLVDSFLQKYLSVRIDPSMSYMLIPFFVFFHILFLRSLLLSKTKSPSFVYRISKALGIYCGFVLLVLIGSYNYQNMHRFALTSVYFLYFFEIINFGFNLWQGLKYRKANARFIALGLVPILVYVFIVLLNYMAITKPIIIPDMVMWSILFDNFVLCVGLVYRFGAAAKREIDLQKKMNNQLNNTIELQKQFNTEIQAKLEAQQKLQRISRDLHDNIGAQLTNITINIDYLQNHNKNNNTNLILNNLRQQISNTTQQLRDTIWAINKGHIKLNELANRIIYYVQKQTNHNQNIAAQFDINIENQEVKIETEPALSMFRIVQECLQNVLKHSQASQISLSFTEKNKKINLRFSDNGQGFDQSKAHDGFGLQNIKNRADELKAVLLVKSSVQKGTQISIEWPLT